MSTTSSRMTEKQPSMFCLIANLLELAGSDGNSRKAENDTRIYYLQLYLALRRRIFKMRKPVRGLLIFVGFLVHRMSFLMRTHKEINFAFCCSG